MSQTAILPMTPQAAGKMQYKKRQGLGKSVKVGRSRSRCRRSTRLVGLAAIGFEVPEIDSSGLVGLAVLG